MNAHVLIPCKSLSEGKSRLRGLLSPTARWQLCARLLSQTLQLALALQSSERILLISPDSDAATIARKHNIRAVVDNGDNLNEALRQGRGRILRNFPEGAPALILPIDLVHATPAALSTLMRPDLDLVIAPDEAGRGTNGLYLGADVLRKFPFAFGPDSFLAHRRWAELQGVRIEVIHHPLLAFDLDGPDAYDRWRTGAQARVAGSAQH